MEFKKTYEQGTFCKPYYYVNGKRVSAEKFNYEETHCHIKGMQYNSSILYSKGKRYHACFSYN